VKRAVEVAAAGGHNILRLEAGGARLRLALVR
jgi:predicted ATPase with chaperone activity